MKNVFPIGFQVSVDDQILTVVVEAWDSNTFLDQQYDISSSPGTAPEGMSLIVDFDVSTGEVRLVGDGTEDGVLSGPQAAIEVRIETVGGD